MWIRHPIFLYSFRKPCAMLVRSTWVLSNGGNKSEFHAISFHIPSTFYAWVNSIFDSWVIHMDYIVCCCYCWCLPQELGLILNFCPLPVVWQVLVIKSNYYCVSVTFTLADAALNPTTMLIEHVQKRSKRFFAWECGLIYRC